MLDPREIIFKCLITMCWFTFNIQCEKQRTIVTLYNKQKKITTAFCNNHIAEAHYPYEMVESQIQKAIDEIKDIT